MSADAAYIDSLRAQIDAVYRTSGGPEPVIYANLRAKELSADFIDRVGKRKSISVHVKRQMALCLTALEQAKDAAGKALMMPDVEEEAEVNAAKKAKVEEPAAASSDEQHSNPECIYKQKGNAPY